MNNQRLIDANTLVGPDGLFATRGCTGNCECCNLWSKEGCRVILEAPTVNAVEVVYCKDCKHYKRVQGAIGGWCDCELTPFDMDPNDFCSHGERQTELQND